MCIVQVLCSCEVKTRWGFVRANWRARVSQKFLARLYDCGVYMEVSGGFSIDFGNIYPERLP